MDADKEKKEENRLFLSIKEYIDSAVDNELVTLNKNGLMTTKENSERFNDEIRKKHENKVFDLIQHEIENDAKLITSFFNQVKVDDIAIYEKLIENQLDEETVNKKLQACRTVEDFSELYSNPLSTENLQQLNEIGKKWFNNGAFDKALFYFHYLVTAEPKNVDNWLSKAITEQNLTKYQEAIQSYFIVIDLKPEYLLSYLQVIECLILNNQIEEGKIFFTNLIGVLETIDYSENELYVTKIKSLNDFLLAAA